MSAFYAGVDNSRGNIRKPPTLRAIAPIIPVILPSSYLDLYATTKTKAQTCSWPWGHSLAHRASTRSWQIKCFWNICLLQLCRTSVNAFAHTLTHFNFSFAYQLLRFRSCCVINNKIKKMNVMWRPADNPITSEILCDHIIANIWARWLWREAVTYLQAWFSGCPAIFTPKARLFFAAPEQKWSWFAFFRL